jgi:hypothetical protein
MHRKAFGEIQRLVQERAFGWDEVTVVSGGAAWSDHIALTVWEESGCHLELHFAAPWDADNKCYAEREKNSKYCPGRTGNYYHERFSRRMAQQGDEQNLWSELNSLEHLHYATQHPDCTIVVTKGFKNRNTKVAKVDRVIAFTFGRGEIPKDGGTKDTWDKAVRNGAICKHFSLTEVK